MGDGNEAWKPALDAGCNKNCSCRSFGKENRKNEEDKMGRKRFLALVMALSMLFTLMAPAFAFADGDITVKFTDSLNWGKKAYIHYFDSNEVGTTWPGYEMQCVETNSYGQKVYQYTIPASANVHGIVFNDGNHNHQTVDITSNIYNGQWWYAISETDER